MKRLLSAILLFGGGLMAHAQTEVAPYRPGLTTDGITYFLPKTALHVTVVATRAVYTPGEYAAYAERYLRLRNVSRQASEKWNIESVAITPYGVADKSQAYTIKLKSKTSAPLVSMASDGRLLAVNSDERPADPTLSVASVKRDTSKAINGADFKTEEILAAGSVTKMAELTANEIYDIRDNRSLLTKGQADFMPKDGEQLKLMLKQLDTQEEGLLQLFKGTTRTETHTFTLDYIPSGEVDKELLFRFSAFYGLVDKDDLSGAPYYISVQDLHTLPAVSDAESGKSKKEVEDLRYIVPGRANVTISNAERAVCMSSFPMAQFGRIEHLGGELFNKKYTTSVVMDPETGGIQRIDAAQP